MNTEQTASAASWLVEISTGLGLKIAADQLDICSASGDPVVGLVPVSELRRFADKGHRFDLVAERGSLGITFNGDGSGPFTVEAHGSWEDAFDEEQAAEARNAAVNDPELLLKMCDGFDGHLTLTVIHPADRAGCHWIRTTTALISMLNAKEWPASLDRLLSGPTLTVVGDAARASIVCGDLVIAGPEAEAVSVRGDDDMLDAQRYQAALPQSDLRQSLHRPSQIEPVGGNGLDIIRRLLTGATSSLVWLWLGSSANMEPGPPTVRFDRVLPLDAAFPAAERQDASDDLKLWRWAISGNDMSRRDAVQQAVALVVKDARDLARAAPRVLSAARFLHEASQRGLLAQALAARRSAYEAVASAAQTAADTSRGVARATFDRVLVQVAASAGLLLAAKDDLLNFWVALFLGLAVVALLGGTAANAFGSDYKSASLALRAFKYDLAAAYGDALTSDDIAGLRKMSALSGAGDAIRRSRRATFWTLLGAGVVVVGLLVVTLVYAR